MAEMLFDSESFLQKSTLDQLFQETARYRASAEYHELLSFVGRLPYHAPYNAFLLHTQNPEARYVANARKWRENFGRSIVAGARPLLILVPFGPVDFVYDAADTEGEPLPAGLLEPFKSNGEVPLNVWLQTCDNCAGELVLIEEVPMGREQAGKISSRVSDTHFVSLAAKNDKGERVHAKVPARYVVTLNAAHDATTKYVTLTHELAHLYCGHLGTPHPKWWPDRSGLSAQQEEFEAESAAYLVCARLGIDNPSARYLSGYFALNRLIPPVSLEMIFKVAGHIERMGREALKPRKWD